MSGFFYCQSESGKEVKPIFYRIFAKQIRNYRVAVTLLPDRGLLDRGPLWVVYVLA